MKNKIFFCYNKTLTAREQQIQIHLVISIGNRSCVEQRIVRQN